MSESPSPDAFIALSVATAVPGLWSFLCPPVLDQDPYDDATTRLQQTKAVVASLGLGTVAACIARKPWPFLAAVLMVVLMLIEFEHTRTRTRTRE